MLEKERYSEGLEKKEVLAYEKLGGNLFLYALVALVGFLAGFLAGFYLF